MTVGQRIKQRRMELGMTQSELAEKMGYKGKTSVCAAETKGDNITTTKITKYAKALGVSIKYLMGYEDINGVPISQERVEYKAKITDYREDFVYAAIETYKDIQSLSPEKRNQLESFLQYLKTQS